MRAGAGEAGAVCAGVLTGTAGRGAGTGAGAGEFRRDWPQKTATSSSGGGVVFGVLNGVWRPENAGFPRWFWMPCRGGVGRFFLKSRCPWGLGGTWRVLFAGRKGPLGGR